MKPSLELILMATKTWQKPILMPSPNGTITKGQYDQMSKALGHPINWRPTLHRSWLPAEKALYAGSSAIDAGDGCTR